MRRKMTSLLQWHLLIVFLNPGQKKVIKTKFTKCILKIKRFILERAEDLLQRKSYRSEYHHYQ